MSCLYLLADASARDTDGHGLGYVALELVHDITDARQLSLSTWKTLSYDVWVASWSYKQHLIQTTSLLH